MNRIAKLDRREREELFLATAYDIKLPEAMAEKDFWVCWTLGYLFHQCPWAKHIAFKGGTSLSKCFGLIERFSEDIDLILDWRVLGYSASDPWAERSKTRQDILNKEMNARTCNFLREVFLPQLKEDFAQLLSEPFKLFINDDEPQTVCFAYPRIFDDSAIVSVVRMEIGALAAWTPTQTVTITSYAAEVSESATFQYPKSLLLIFIPFETSMSCNSFTSTSPKLQFAPFTASAAAVPAASPVTAHVGITLVISHMLSVTEMHRPAVIRFFTLFPYRVL